MPIRRSGACDQRRRRVLIEENLHATEGECESRRVDPSEVNPGTVRLPGRRYSEEASADRQQPLTAVIPKRLWTLTVLLLTGLSLIAGIQALYGQAALQPRDYWLRSIAALDVESAGSLASWCSSIFLLAAAIQGLQIYRLRRHRADDYRGRYRIWVWVPPALLVASLVVGTDLHRDLFVAVSLRWEGLGGVRPELASYFVPAVIWLLAALRLVFEVRESRASLAALVCATLAYSSAGMLGMLSAGEPFSLPGAMTISSLAMLGHLTALLMVASYSRYVYLDARGELAVREKRPKQSRRQRTPGNKDTVDGRVVDESAGEAPSIIPISAAKVERESGAAGGAKETRKHPTAGEPSSASPTARLGPNRGDASSEPPAPDDAMAGDEDEISEAGLSKAERRRLRKVKRREQPGKAA